MLTHFLLHLRGEVGIALAAGGGGGGGGDVVRSANHGGRLVRHDPSGGAKLRMNLATSELLVLIAEELLNAHGGLLDEPRAEGTRGVAAGACVATVDAEVFEEAARKLGELAGGGGEATEPRVDVCKEAKHVHGRVEVAGLHLGEVHHARIGANADVRQEARDQHGEVGRNLSVGPRIGAGHVAKGGMDVVGKIAIRHPRLDERAIVEIGRLVCPAGRVGHEGRKVLERRRLIHVELQVLGSAAPPMAGQATPHHSHGGIKLLVDAPHL